MAKVVHETLLDDLDHKAPADETVVFGLDGKTYEIDLSDENAAKLRKTLHKYVTAGRKVAKPRKPTSANPRHKNNAAVRAWANANGFSLGSRGRIPDEVYAAHRQR